MNPCAPSFGSEPIFAFFRHHGLDGLCDLPSRQYNSIYERPEIVLRDGDTA